MSGYGRTGPYADRPGYDAILQGEGGMMSITGPIDGPPSRAGIPIIAEDTGLDYGRSVYFHLVDGRLEVRSLKKGDRVI